VALWGSVHSPGMGQVAVDSSPSCYSPPLHFYLTVIFVLLYMDSFLLLNYLLSNIL
jgi:hypothetical protein